MSFADKVTTIRIILIPVFVSLLIYSRWHFYLRHIATAVFIIAVLSDFFDGLVARIKKEKSNIGQVIDPLADKLLLFTAFISLYVLREYLPLKFQIPLGVVLIVVSRDLIILLGFLIFQFLKIEIVVAPSIWGKLTTFFQMGTILCILINVPFSPFIWKVATVFTLISGLDYFLRGVKAINDNINSSAS
ncbi:MAG: CDP-alcohol phosphatidyltransferase family protein [Candidatus Omnitrophota bacterium]|nr:MAG: CDP-alcohol phosphatidyltransferase family protein [Candidatus Omnitrophota bacterium]